MLMFVLNQTTSVANHFIAELRDSKIQHDRLRFRRNLERVGEVLAYEISKTLNYEPSVVQTPLGEAQESLLTDRIVLATILRAGLPFHQGMLNFFDRADSAFVSAYRRHYQSGEFEIKMEYVSAPNLDDAVLILTDPMLATGASMEIVLRELLEMGKPREVHVAAVIASTNGVDRIRRMFPDVKLWLGALDEELTAKAYIVPGLGDAGDLAYGDKD